MGTAGFKYSWRKMEAAAQDSWMETWPMLHWVRQGLKGIGKEFQQLVIRRYLEQSI